MTAFMEAWTRWEIPMQCVVEKPWPASWTTFAPYDMKPSINQSPIMIEVPPARIPEEPGAVIPHAGICEGVFGKPTSIPLSLIINYQLFTYRKKQIGNRHEPD
jgi:hypothetical protein